MRAAPRLASGNRRPAMGAFSLPYGAQRLRRSAVGFGGLALRPGFRPKARRPSLGRPPGSRDETSLGEQSSSCRAGRRARHRASRAAPATELNSSPERRTLPREVGAGESPTVTFGGRVMVSSGGPDGTVARPLSCVAPFPSREAFGRPPRPGDEKHARSGQAWRPTLPSAPSRHSVGHPGDGLLPPEGRASQLGHACG